MEHAVLVLENGVERVQAAHYEHEHELTRFFVQITDRVGFLLAFRLLVRSKNLFGLFNQKILRKLKKLNPS